MNRAIHIKNKLAATFFLVVFCSFYVVSIICNTGLKEILFIQNHDHNSHSHTHNDVHSHSSSHHDMDENAAQSHDDASDEGCCKDVTLAFFASLKNSKILKFEIKKVYELASVYYTSDTYIAFNKNSELNPLSIPFFRPKVPDVRIFIRSFII